MKRAVLVLLMILAMTTVCFAGTASPKFCDFDSKHPYNPIYSLTGEWETKKCDTKAKAEKELEKVLKNAGVYDSKGNAAKWEMKFYAKVKGSWKYEGKGQSRAVKFTKYPYVEKEGKKWVGHAKLSLGGNRRSDYTCRNKKTEYKGVCDFGIIKFKTKSATHG